MRRGGIAAAIWAVEAVKRAGLKLRGTVEHSGVVDEESTGIRNAGAGWLVEQGHVSPEKVDGVVITEPLNVEVRSTSRVGVLQSMATNLWRPSERLPGSSRRVVGDYRFSRCASGLRALAPFLADVLLVSGRFSRCNSPSTFTLAASLRLACLLTLLVLRSAASTPSHTPLRSSFRCFSLAPSLH